MAFRNVNRRRHVGLQQLSSLASTGRTLLGPLKSYKFIVNESTNESVLACSVVRLLESLDLTSAVGQLLNETIQAQSKEYKTGTTTLLFLAGAWSSAVLECLQQNVPVPVIVSVMSEGLHSCSERAKCLQVSVHDLYKGPDSVPIPSNFNSARPQISENKTPSAASTSFLNPSMHLHKDVPVTEDECVPEGPCSHQANTCDLHNRYFCSPTYAAGRQMHSAVGPVGDKTMLSIPGTSLITSSCNKIKLTHSRHFNAVGKKCSLLHVGSFQGNPIGPSAHCYEYKDFGQLAMALSHGNQSSMKLVQDIVRCQQWKTNPTGYVTSVSPENAAVTKQLKGQLLQILLVDGDLSEKYRHLGFNRPTNVKTVSESLGVQESSSGCSWTSRMLDILMQSEVNLILVKGNVCEHLMERCILNNILIINPVTQNVLYAFARVTGAKPVTYLTQVNSQCVGGGVWVDFWRIGELSTEELESRMLISIKAEGSTLVTAVLSSTVISKMQVIDDQFWTCAYRLQHALTDGKVFPGGGAVELFCLSHVQKLVDQALNQANKNSAGEFHSAPCWMAESLAEFKPLVLKALASGWHKYLSTVMCNSANFTSEFEASISIKHHLKKVTVCGSPSAYILQEFNLREVVGKVGPDPLTKCTEFVQVYDNVTAKLEAWRRALDLVLLVLQTDSEIITGPKRNELLSSPLSSEFVFI
uniref:Bardet-Biedl syndrome 12 n=1 Tax=Crocodylus porosus TaxID=8502 RepID=A0A7M4FTL3_CROPO